MRTRNQRGNAIMEFTLVGIPVVFLIYATVMMGLAMWNYHTLAYSVNEATQYAAARGQGCVTNGNSCSVTIGTIANLIQLNGIGLSASQLNVTFTTASGQSQACAPITSCLSDSTVWPPSTNSDNQPGKTIQISAQYAFSSGLKMVWPGTGAFSIGAIGLPAQSKQLIVF